MSDSLNIGFIGLGLIGGSIAKSLKRFHPQTRIFAYTRTEATLDLAVSEGIVDVKCTKEDEAFASCNYIFLCAPVHDNISYLEWLKDHMSPDCIVTDVGFIWRLRNWDWMTTSSADTRWPVLKKPVLKMPPIC